MYLTISKRLEFSASFRYFVKQWSPRRNAAFFGRAVGSPHGYGGNFAAFFVFHGPVDPENGMLINVTTIKQRVQQLLHSRYDHKFLNGDTPPFDQIVPTPENLVRRLFQETAPLFDGESASLVVCHLEQTPSRAATAYANGRIEQHHGLEFSAARRTWSPRLSEKQNERLFGAAAADHGHHYRLRVTLVGDIDPIHGFIFPDKDSDQALNALQALLDHRNLNRDVPDLQDLPITTECLARFIHQRLRPSLPLSRVTLWENPWFYAEYDEASVSAIGIRAVFPAAHRLHSPGLSDEENRRVYDICNNPRGHGHLYQVEATVEDALDERTGTVGRLADLRRGVQRALEPWAYRHLDQDTDDFKDRPSTSENIIQVLWPRIEDAIHHPLKRLRLWETPNNRFTQRRDVM